MGKLKFVKATTTGVPLATLEKGDMFLREGALCMRVETMWSRPSERLGIPVINLCTGRVWNCSDGPVEPIDDATITFTKP